MLPLSEERRNNNIYGENQKLAGWEEKDGNIVFTWDKVTSEHGGIHNIRIKLTVRAEGRQAVFEMEIDNRSEYTVENVYCPYIADIAPPKGAAWLKTFSQRYAQGQEMDIWPQFTNTVGYFGADYPTLIPGGIGAPTTPFILLRSENQGLYMGVKSNSCDWVAWFGELRPGWGSSIDSRVPETMDIAGKPVQKRFAALHLPFVQAGEKKTLTPVALEAYEGGWQEGADIYSAWRKTWLKPAAPPAWAKEPHAWQQIHINSPEDELRMRFVDLPKAAETCKKYGVDVIQLVGWNDGGQDQGNPSHDPDPRLGTFEELREAIGKCHEMGIKVILFTKFTWADRATEAFRNEYIKYSIKDPYGDYYVYGGYLYQTGTQLLDINTKRLIPMCFGSEEYMKVCEREFKKIVDLGAAGMLFDECQHHYPTRLCFDTGHGHRYAWPTYTNDRKFIERMWKSTEVPEDFLMAGEACYDWLMEAYHMAYFRSESKDYIPLNRYLHPECQYMTAVTGFNDRNMINQCLMFRYIISYEPYNFKGRLDDYPETVAYGRKMESLRTELRAYFWDGEFRDEQEASVTTADGKPHKPYAVFRHKDTKKIGVVISNYSHKETVTVFVKPESGETLTQYRLVDNSEWKPAQKGISIPPCSAAVVIA
jgi:sugar phosphate isomerase/epimerase